MMVRKTVGQPHQILGISVVLLDGFTVLFYGFLVIKFSIITAMAQ